MFRKNSTFFFQRGLKRLGELSSKSSFTPSSLLPASSFTPSPPGSLKQIPQSSSSVPSSVPASPGVRTDFMLKDQIKKLSKKNIRDSSPQEPSSSPRSTKEIIDSVYPELKTSSSSSSGLGTWVGSRSSSFVQKPEQKMYAGGGGMEDFANSNSDSNYNYNYSAALGKGGVSGGFTKPESFSKPQVREISTSNLLSTYGTDAQIDGEKVRLVLGLAKIFPSKTGEDKVVGHILYIFETQKDEFMGLPLLIVQDLGNTSIKKYNTELGLPDLLGNQDIQLLTELRRFDNKDKAIADFDAVTGYTNKYIVQEAFSLISEEYIHRKSTGHL